MIQSIPMEEAIVNGHDVEYSITGPSRGEWIVLIHGSVFADMFVPMMSHPSLSNYSILHYHRRGYGGRKNNMTAPASMKEQSLDCIRLMESLNIDSAHLVAHSYAGLIAIQAAVDTPQKVHTLTLMEPPLVAFVPDGAEIGKKIQNSLSLYQEGKKFESLDSFLKVVFEGTKDYRKIIDNQIGNKAFDEALTVLDTMFQLEYPALQSWKFDPTDAKSLSMPVLSVTGTNSPEFFKQVHSLLHSWFPHLESLVIQDTNHLLHIQKPESVAKGLASFFVKHPMNK